MTNGKDVPRIGIDLGGTKIEGLALNGANEIVAGPMRMATPRHDYCGTVDAICGLVGVLEGEVFADKSGADGSDLSGELVSPKVGIGIPGSIVRTTGRVQNANSTWLNAQSFASDLIAKLGRRVRLANDANCFALSEAVDGAGADVRCVFGVILGTGCGGGLVVNKGLLSGRLGIGGEWGHNPLPWARDDELAGPSCWCGRQGCIETWVSGPGLSAQYRQSTGDTLDVEQIVERANGGDVASRVVLDRHADRLARGLAQVINIVDPDVIVLGGGLSKLEHLYRDLPGRIAPYLFTDAPAVDIRAPRWGDASGVRGAAWLWN